MIVKEVLEEIIDKGIPEGETNKVKMDLWNKLMPCCDHHPPTVPHGTLRACPGCRMPFSYPYLFVMVREKKYLSCYRCMLDELKPQHPDWRPPAMRGY